MFDVSLSELLVIGLVALIVIGPEKLPRVARAMGLLAGRVQRYVSNVKSEIEREIHLEDLKKIQENIQQHSQQAMQSVSELEANATQQKEIIEQSIAGGLNQPLSPEQLPKSKDKN